MAAVPGLDVGTKPQDPAVFMSLPSPPLQNSGTGFLGAIPVSLYTPDNAEEFWAGNLSFVPRPYFTPVAVKDNTFEEVNGVLLGQTYDILDRISALDLPSGSGSPAASRTYTRQAQALLRQIPHGAVLFGELSSTRVNYTIQVGTIRRLAYLSSNANVTGASHESSELTYAGFPLEGERRLRFMSLVDRAILRRAHPLLANHTITHGLRIMPVNESTVVPVSVGSFAGAILYPFGLSFLLPVFVVSLVREKEERIMVMMTMNGMRTWVYWCCEYVHFYVLHAISATVFVLTGLLFRLEFFVNTDPGAYILLLFVWGHAQIAMAFFLATFFNRSRVALLLVFCLVLAGVVINLGLNYIFLVPPNIGYLFYPPFAFYRALNLINMRATDPSAPNFTMAMLVPGEEVFSCLCALLVETVVVLLVGSYLMAVLPSEFGVPRPWHFVVTEPFTHFREFLASRGYNSGGRGGAVALASQDVGVQAIDIEQGPGMDEEEGEAGDEDVKAEEERVLRGQYPANSAVVIKNLKKRYPTGKHAVKGVSLAIEVTGGRLSTVRAWEVILIFLYLPRLH